MLDEPGDRLEQTRDKSFVTRARGCMIANCRRAIRVFLSQTCSPCMFSHVISSRICSTLLLDTSLFDFYARQCSTWEHCDEMANAGKFQFTSSQSRNIPTTQSRRGEQPASPRHLRISGPNYPDASLIERASARTAACSS